MKKIQYLAICAAAFLTLTTGCKKEETGEMVDVTFDVVIAKEAAKADDSTKVYLDNNFYPNWNSGDPIRVNNGDGTVTPSGTSGIAATRGTFTASITSASDHKYYAVFPASAAKKITTTSTGTSTEEYDLHSTQKVFLPRVQPYETYTDNADNGTIKQKINAPMFAYTQTTVTTTGTNTTESRPVLQFHNLCGMMKITVTNDKAWDMVLDSIQVEAKTKRLNGEFSITSPTSDAPYVVATTNAVDLFDVDARESNIVSLGGIDAILRTSELSSSRTGISDKPTSIDLYVYLPTIPSTDINENLFYIRVFTHPVWRTSTSTYTPDPEVHISYEIRQTSSTNAYVARNSIIPICINLSNCEPTFTSLKAFTVADGTRVSISRGQAQYYIDNISAETSTGDVSSQTSTGYWRFSPRQWDFLYMRRLKHDSEVNDYTEGKWIEHFTWDSGNWPIHHWKAASDVGSTNTDFRNWTGDWGANFTNKTNNTTWYTLTQTQYNYLLKERVRTNHNNKQNFAWIELTDVTGGRSYNGTSNLYGIMIVPDVFIGLNSNDDATLSYLNITTFYYYHSTTPTTNDVATRRRNDNSMTKAQFEYYEAKGCVLLPCFGVFNALGNEVGPIYAPTYAGSPNYPEGDYWSKSASSGNDAYMLQIEADQTTSASPADCRTRENNLADGEKYRKFMVRLVRDYHSGGGDYKYDPFQ